jgi:hypothetical protein
MEWGNNMNYFKNPYGGCRIWYMINCSFSQLKVINAASIDKIELHTDG